MDCNKLLSFLLVSTVLSLGRAQITIDIVFQTHGWSSSVQDNSSLASLEFCLQPLQPFSDVSCPQGMYLVARDDIRSDADGEVDIAMEFYSPGSLATKLQLLFKVYSSSRTLLEELDPFRLDASNTSTNEIDMESSIVGMVTLSYTKSFSDCIDDSGLGAELSSHLESAVGLLAALLVLCLVLCLLLAVVAMVTCRQWLFTSGQGRKLTYDEEQPPDKMGSMLSLGTPSAYSYPRIDMNSPPASNKGAITMSKPPVPDRLAPTSVPTLTQAASITTPVVTAPTLEVTMTTETATLAVVEDTPAPSAKGGTPPITFKQKKKNQKEKKGKKAKPVVQNTTRYDSNPAYMYTTVSKEQEAQQ